MDLKRFFSDNTIDGEFVTLTGDEFYHAVKVTRHKVGYKLIVCDNTFWDYYATVTEIGKNYLTAKIDKKQYNDVENKKKITLFIGVNKDLDTVVQKAVELGVDAIVPFISDHCNVKNFSLDRMNKIILESSKQCGRSILATICPPIDFHSVIEQTKSMQTFAFYEFERTNRVHYAIIEEDKDIAIIIGCEGGFSAPEYKMIKEAGIKTYTLGKRILRVATAVVAACVLVNEKTEEGIESGSF